MVYAPLQIQMLGEFSIRSGSAEISDSDNRSRKVWLLLAYMIYCRDRAVNAETLVSLLWGDEERSANPLNALKTMFHRARNCLNQLEDNAGHRLIVRKGGNYAWNTSVPIILDIDEFDALCKAGGDASDPDQRLDCWTKALALYHGDFLEKMSSELWVVPIAAHYHNLYVQTALATIEMLEQRQNWQEAADLCRAALVFEPYMEELYRYLMIALVHLDDRVGAVSVYENMSALLLANFGIMPSEESLSLYRELVRTTNTRTVPPGTILEQLREPDSDRQGALLCDYDMFRSIYHALARSIARSGDAIHLALISIVGAEDKELSRRSLDRVVDNLQELICANLRRGDIAARCSVSQFVLLLPQANYENSRMVCDRINRSFTRQYPHSPAQLSISVHPLEPFL